jgi:hypothetical protein
MNREHLVSVQKLYDTTEAGAAIAQLMKDNRALSEALNDICVSHQDAIDTPLLLAADKALKQSMHE